MTPPEIVYEDKNIIAVNKKAGMPVQPDLTGDKSLLEYVEEHTDTKAFLVSRLDRPVSGLILLAKNKKFASLLSRALQDAGTQKIYYAITENKCKKDRGVFEDLLLKKDKKAHIIEKPHPKAKKALLQYEYMGKSERYFFYKIKLLTGRFHQIRSQFAFRHCPVKDDVKYGARRSNRDKTIFLHSYQLILPYPGQQDRILRLTAPFPEGVLWDVLRKKIEKTKV